MAVNLANTNSQLVCKQIIFSSARAISTCKQPLNRIKKCRLHPDRARDWLINLNWNIVAGCFTGNYHSGNQWGDRGEEELMIKWATCGWRATCNNYRNEGSLWRCTCRLADMTVSRGGCEMCNTWRCDPQQPRPSHADTEFLRINKSWLLVPPRSISAGTSQLLHPHDYIPSLILWEQLLVTLSVVKHICRAQECTYTG